MKQTYIAVDLDGTLLNDKNLISRRDVDSINRLPSDIGVIVATGRMFPAALRVLSNQIEPDYLISMNGAVLAVETSQTFLIEKRLKQSLCFSIVDWCRHEKLGAILCGLFEAYSIREDEKVRTYSKRTGVPIKMLDRNFCGTDIFKAIVYAGSPGELSEENLKDKISKYFVSADCIVCTSAQGHVEIMALNVSKGIAIDLIKGRRTEVFSIGNAENDISMFLSSTFSAAVDNASPQVKSYADIIVPSCNNNGVSVAIDCFLKLL